MIFSFSFFVASIFLRRYVWYKTFILSDKKKFKQVDFYSTKEKKKNVVNLPPGPTSFLTFWLIKETGCNIPNGPHVKKRFIYRQIHFYGALLPDIPLRESLTCSTQAFTCKTNSFTIQTTDLMGRS